ncbi:hypothetical protein F5J12DRAFT_714604 [Pisolithus orientalis]|uniref:uncharacterized protein n=1 Tax=Pisolithus orientalis TaxID=936130 RepID=UPI002224C973|nr:uncharacterized protein F5J12DRAFT_714604 [Pisolithus orientalis]KAI6028781.1 hypothetical protein F5J12DRAFT_714604 [Pisolithus orientalis]
MSDTGEHQPLLPASDIEAVPSRRNRPSTLAAWRQNTAQFLESPGLHTFVITLITIDVACVLADLGYSFLSNGCIPPEGPESPAWLEVLANISLAINTFFLIEIPLALWSFGIKFFLPLSNVPHASFHLFDAIIIITTVVLEFVLKGKERELVGLLITLRMWRLVKLVGGIAVGAGEVEEEVLKELDETKRKLEGTSAALAKAREENRKLRARVLWLETGGSEGTPDL